MTPLPKKMVALIRHNVNAHLLSGLIHASLQSWQLAPSRVNVQETDNSLCPWSCWSFTDHVTSSSTSVFNCLLFILFTRLFKWESKVIRPSTCGQVVSMWPVYLFAYSMAGNTVWFCMATVSDQSPGPFSLVLICTLYLRKVCCLYCP